MTPEHELEAREEWFEPEFGPARRRYAELEHDPEREPVRAALERIHSSLTGQDYDLPGPLPVNQGALNRLGVVYSKIENPFQQRYEQLEQT